MALNQSKIALTFVNVTINIKQTKKSNIFFMKDFLS